MHETSRRGKEWPSGLAALVVFWLLTGLGEAAPPAAPTLVAPSGLVPSTTQAFTWQAASGATWYQLWVNDAVAAPKLTQWYTAQQATCAEGTGACTVLVSAGLAVGPGRWFVAAWNPEGTAWSAGLDFTVRWVAGGWEQALPAAERFQLVLGGAAVLDRETGVVWERAPSYSGQWGGSRDYCHLNFAGGQRRGWRLPGLLEAFSLSPLPAGHPFQLPGGFTTIWTATSFQDNPAEVWTVWPAAASANHVARTLTTHAWCVRGGPGHDAQ